MVFLTNVLYDVNKWCIPQILQQCNPRCFWSLLFACVAIVSVAAHDIIATDTVYTSRRRYVSGAHLRRWNQRSLSVLHLRRKFGSNAVIPRSQWDPKTGKQWTPVRYILPPGYKSQSFRLTFSAIWTSAITRYAAVRLVICDGDSIKALNGLASPTISLARNTVREHHPGIYLAMVVRLDHLR